MRKATRSIIGSALFAASLVASCAAPPPAAPPPSIVRGDIDPLQIQALVMSMADDYIAALGESVYLLARSGELDPKARWLAQSFLRNGVGASLDIGAGPNPPVDLLDLLVTVSLQAWAFEAHWMPAGIGEAGRPALARLRRAEADLWRAGQEVLSPEQARTLRQLVDQWIAEHPDRTVVALVRFAEFADERKTSSLAVRGEAQGLLREVSDAAGAIDDARLLGERLLWYAGRYPYLLGEQAELTTYRLIDQPEGTQLIEAVESIRRLSDLLAERAGTIGSELEAQQAGFFDRVAAERAAAVQQAQEALQATVRESLDDAATRLDAERREAIDQLFDRFAQERSLLLDDIESRQDELRGIMTELRETITVSSGLARELTGTVDAIDRVVSRFDVDPGGAREPLRMTDVRDAAIETARAAERMTRVLELTNELLESEALDRRLSSLTDPAGAVVDRAFWRGLILVGVLLAGVALLRLVPVRTVRR